MKRAICLICLVCATVVACQILEPKEDTTPSDDADTVFITEGNYIPSDDSVTVLVTEGSYFPLSEGRIWVYSRSEGRNPPAYKTVTMGLLRDDGWMHATVVYEYCSDSGDISRTTHYDDYYRLDDKALTRRHDPDVWTQQETLLTLPPRFDASWNSKNTDSIGPRWVAATDTTVTVPVGTYSGVVAVRQGIHVDGIYSTRYYAPGIGLIARETVSWRSGGEPLEMNRWALTSYE
jgi:hypothetical protein